MIARRCLLKKLSLFSIHSMAAGYLEETLVVLRLQIALDVLFDPSILCPLNKPSTKKPLSGLH